MGNLKFSSLSSGSKANCTYVEVTTESGVTKILIDCGLSAACTTERLISIDVNPNEIDFILVTHEHADHIRGIPVFSHKYKVPVYTNYLTQKHIKRAYGFELFSGSSSFTLNNVTINPFSIVHDAEDPVGFSISSPCGLKFSYATDLGKVTTVVREALKNSHCIILESNHDLDMLNNCSYSWKIKQRISSSYGHLSNDAASELLKDIYHEGLQYVILGHISENSNTPSIALSTIQESFDFNIPFDLRCGSVFYPTPLLDLA